MATRMNRRCFNSALGLLAAGVNTIGEQSVRQPNEPEVVGKTGT